MPALAKPKRTLKVVFDTSVLWTQSNTDLVRAEIRKLIQDHSTHPDLQVSWLIPEIVFEERKYQMLEATRALLPALSKLEPIFGFHMDTSAESLNTRISAIINTQIAELGFSIIKFEPANIDLRKVMIAAAHRIAPFEAGKTEKGFRDQLVLETLCELASSSPKTQAICRIAFLTGDELLRSAAEERLSTATNVKYFTESEELKSLIQTLVSTIDDEFIDEIADKASQLFFDPENKQTVYWKENIHDKIFSAYQDTFLAGPGNGSTPSRIHFSLNRPTFVSKTGQRTHWLSRFIFKFESVINTTPGNSGNALLAALRAGSDVGAPGSPTTVKLSSLMNPPPPIKLVRTHLVDVKWSATLSHARKLSKTSIDKMDIESSSWAAAVAE